MSPVVENTSPRYWVTMTLTLGRHTRMVAFWAMLLPFFLSSFIAQGVMPVRTANGVIMLVICTGNGMVEMAFDAVTMEPVDEADHGDEEGSKGSYCAWAASQLTITLSPLMFLADPLLLVTGIGLSWIHAALEYARATGLPPATGPPYTV